MKTLFTIIMMTAALMGASGGPASGTFTVQGQTMQMKYAYAVQIPDWFDKSNQGTRLIVSDVPAPESAIQDQMELMSLARSGKINAIQFEFGSGRSNVSMSVLSNKLGGSLSVSKNFDAKAIPVFTSERIEGSMTAEPSKLGPMTYQYDVKFATTIAPRVVAAAPTVADTAAAAKSGAAQAYLAFVAAVKTGDKAKMLDLASARVRRMMDQPDFAATLSMVQAMMPSKIQVLKATETGNEARLAVSGFEDGKPKSGAVTMAREDGKWCIVKESWTSGN